MLNDSGFEKFNALPFFCSMVFFFLKACPFSRTDAPKVFSFGKNKPFFDFPGIFADLRFLWFQAHCLGEK
ncbi:MAG: hypothetical protein D6714_07230 [Bacteroidetes bacterium]|nr:MAG: hypothetical protein D6714_07230 [Bacteroidota bacterium]